LTKRPFCGIPAVGESYFNPATRSIAVLRQVFEDGPASHNVVCFPNVNPSATLTRGEWLNSLQGTSAESLSIHQKRRVVDAILDGVTADDGIRALAVICAKDVLLDVFGRGLVDTVTADERRRYIQILRSSILDKIDGFDHALDILSLGLTFGRLFLISVLTKYTDKDEITPDERSLFIAMVSDPMVLSGFPRGEHEAISRIAQTLAT
jgi:hypothetical protein